MIQNAPSNGPQTLIEAVRYFSDPQHCHDYLVSLKWPGGDVCCIECGSTNVGQIKSRRLFQCREKGCRKQFSIKVGTIFQDSPLGLDKWFVGVWMIANCRNGVSSCEIARTLGIKQQSAWHLLHRVRCAMKPRHMNQLSGIVEADVTHVGGLARFMHKAKRKARMTDPHTFKGKVAVHAILERGTELRASVIGRENFHNVRSELYRHVEPGSTVYTDAGSSYKGISKTFVHEWVNHMQEYVRGSVHTNGLENYFSLLRRMLKGTYIAVEPQHLEAYVDEQACRYNWRKVSDAERFHRVMRRVVGKRLAYSTLTGGKKR